VAEQLPFALLAQLPPKKVRAEMNPRSPAYITLLLLNIDQAKAGASARTLKHEREGLRL
jgi:hypothetical protein